MKDNPDKSNLDLLLANALKQYAPHASVPERTALDHLVKQLETKPSDVDFRIQRVKGQLIVECKPITYTEDKRKQTAKPRNQS